MGELVSLAAHKLRKLNKLIEESAKLKAEQTAKAVKATENLLNDNQEKLSLLEQRKRDNARVLKDYKLK